jgi:ABC-type transport system involved in multi-copper enzyme maturation permease subunit
MKINPVLEKEMRIKMRGWRAPILVTVYLGIITIIAALYFLAVQVNTNNGSGMTSFNPETVYMAFILILLFEFILILVITPSLTAGSINGERERQTLDLLLCTKLSPLSITTGKLAASMSQVILLLAASLPVFGIVFLYGGVSLLDFILFILFFLVTALMVGSVGILFSTFFKKSVTATVMTYVFLLVIILGNLIAYIFFGSIYYSMKSASITSSEAYMNSLFFLGSNPFAGFSSVVESTGNIPILSGIIGSMGRAGGETKSFIEYVSLWMVNVGFDIIVSAVSIVLSAWRIRPLK